MIKTTRINDDALLEGLSQVIEFIAKLDTDTAKTVIYAIVSDRNDWVKLIAICDLTDAERNIFDALAANIDSLKQIWPPTE